MSAKSASSKTKFPHPRSIRKSRTSSKKDLPKKKEHPKLIKNIGNGNVQCGLQDKASNLWFVGEGGLSRYDGKSFTCFKDGLINPWIWTILEDKTRNLWVGTRETRLYLFDGKIFINYSEYKQ